MKTTVRAPLAHNTWLSYARCKDSSGANCSGLDSYLALVAISSGENTGTMPLGCNQGEVTRSNRLPRVSASSELSRVNTRSLE